MVAINAQGWGALVVNVGSEVCQWTEGVDGRWDLLEACPQICFWHDAARFLGAALSSRLDRLPARRHVEDRDAVLWVVLSDLREDLGVPTRVAQRAVDPDILAGLQGGLRGNLDAVAGFAMGQVSCCRRIPAQVLQGDPTYGWIHVKNFQ